MDLVTHTDLGALDALEPGWRALWDSDPAANVFATPEYLRPWWSERGSGRPLIVEMRQAGALSGLALLTISDDRVLRFAGDPDVTDYHGPVAGPDQREAVAAGLLEAVSAVDGWDVAEFDQIAADSGWPEALTRAAKAADMEVREATGDVCPRVALPGEYGAYLEGLPQKLRHEIRRKARRLEREGGPWTVRLTDGSTLDADLERFFEMHRRSEGPKGHFLHESVASFFSALARSFLARGALRLSWLDLAGRPVAAVLSFAERGIWNVYNSAFDHTKRELGPGMVLMAESIRLACEEGAHTFDLLRGDEPYKYRFGAVDTPLVTLTLSRAEA